MPERKGFTLVELLIALVVFSLIASLVFVSFERGLSIWDRADRKFDRWDQIVMFQTWWKGLWHGAETFQFLRQGLFQPLFLGDPQRVVFISSAPLLHAVPSLIELAFQEGALTYAEKSLFSLTPQEIDSAAFLFEDRHTMLSPVEGVVFEYLAVSLADEEAWVPRFDAASTLRIPRAVKVRFVYKTDALEILAGLPGAESSVFKAVVPRII